jgi:hypothetical protein
MTDIYTLNLYRCKIKFCATVVLRLIHTYHAVPLPLLCHDPAIFRTQAGRPHAVSGRPMVIHT